MDELSKPPTQAKVIWRHFRRNILSVGFPVLVTWAIYADWSRTQRFKKEQAALLKKYESEFGKLEIE